MLSEGRDDVDAIVRLQVEAAGVGGIHLQPGTRCAQADVVSAKAMLKLRIVDDSPVFRGAMPAVVRQVESTPVTISCLGVTL